VADLRHVIHKRELIMADFGPAKKNCAAEMRQSRGKKDIRRTCTKGGSTMSEVIPFPPKPPSKSIEEETKEFLKLLERIRSSSQKSK
jgi:hypothetical protein